MRKALHLYIKRFPNHVHPLLSVFSNIVKTFQETRNADNKKREWIKKALMKFSMNILCYSTKSTLVQDSLNVKVVLVEVFCEYSIPTNFISFISHFIKSDNDFQNCVQFCEWALRSYKKMICLSLKFYLLTKLHLQRMDK